MIVKLEEAKHHLRKDSTEDDIYIQELIQASEQFIKNGTGKTFTNSNSLAKTICMILVAEMYENRLLTTEKVGTRIREIVSMMMTQLAYDDEVVLE